VVGALPETKVEIGTSQRKGEIYVNRGNGAAEYMAGGQGWL